MKQTKTVLKQTKIVQALVVQEFHNAKSMGVTLQLIVQVLLTFSATAVQARPWQPWGHQQEVHRPLSSSFCPPSAGIRADISIDLL